MAQVQNLLTDEEFDVAVTGTRAGLPAPLPDVVAFSPSGPITLVDIDATNKTVRATGAGDYRVDITCDGLPAESVSGTVMAVSADTLAVALGPVRKQA